MKLDWSTHITAAPGSDNWQLTWADDNQLYGAWGDGGGFGGSNSEGRVSLGFARVEGDWSAFRGVNVWGGKDALNPAKFDGKSWGVICVNGVLYMWVVPKSLLAEMQSEARLYWSTNHGGTWEACPWAFQRSDELTIPTICQFGRNYAGAVDQYVYHYFIGPRDASDYLIQKPGTIYLVRCLRTQMLERKSYEFFAGMEGRRVLWSSEVTQKEPVFSDPDNGVGWVCSVSYNAPLKRYILMTEHTASSRGNLGVYEGLMPWGPWTSVAFLSEAADSYFGAGHVPANTFFWNLPTKWHSRDGLGFALVFTGAGRGKDNDSFNVVQGRFELREKDAGSIA